MTEWNNDTVRTLERTSIRDFMERQRSYLRGRVLDFGSGKQPYRDLVEGEYFPFEKLDMEMDLPTHVDAIICNQVMQYLTRPRDTIELFRRLLRPGGHLVMTYPTNWDEVECEDFWRFTKAGMTHLINGAGLSIITHERRAEVNLNGFRFTLGYGVVACR